MWKLLGSIFIEAIIGSTAVAGEAAVKALLMELTMLSNRSWLLRMLGGSLMEMVGKLGVDCVFGSTRGRQRRR